MEILIHFRMICLRVDPYSINGFHERIEYIPMMLDIGGN